MQKVSSSQQTITKEYYFGRLAASFCNLVFFGEWPQREKNLITMSILATTTSPRTNSHHSNDLRPGTHTPDVAEDDSELRDMTRRFWIGMALRLPVFIVAMAHLVPAWSHAGWVSGNASRWRTVPFEHAGRGAGWLAVLRAGVGIRS